MITITYIFQVDIKPFCTTLVGHFALGYMDMKIKIQGTQQCTFVLLLNKQTLWKL